MIPGTKPCGHVGTGEDYCDCWVCAQQGTQHVGSLWPLVLLFATIAACFLLSGCVTTSQPISSVQPACDVLLEPIRYNSVTPKSRRYAGPDLAPDLAVHNRVGINLHCPKYR